MLYLNPNTWQGSYRIPDIKDPRWGIAFLLSLYFILGATVLGFTRRPLQILTIVSFGMLLDVLLQGILKGKKTFPLSAYISCASLVVILHYSLSFYFLWLPVFLTIASKYIFTVNGRHVYNPSLFGICLSLWLGQGFIQLAPAYQWYGLVEMTWAVSVFVLTAAVFIFVFRVQRQWLIVSFLGFYFLQTALRAYVLRNHIPAETLFVGSITSPAFYLFTFYMITDPATSPQAPKRQILQGFLLAFLDLYFHTKFSLYTFFYAGFTIFTMRFLVGQIHNLRIKAYPNIREVALKLLTIAILGVPVVGLFFLGCPKTHLIKTGTFYLKQIDPHYSGINYQKSNILNETDVRVRNVTKWVLSVGDSVAVADVNLDGLPDLFLTQTLKDVSWRSKLYLNQGHFKFQKIAIPDLEKYLNDPKKYGLATFAFFFDYDNDGDEDLFVGFSFGKSHLFKNQIIPTGKLSFEEVDVPFLKENNTVCLAANAADFNNDGWLDLIITNTLPPYLRDYNRKVPFNLFDLPLPEYPGDRRMFHFMHESWHNANNGGLKYLLFNQQGHYSQAVPKEKDRLVETRWSLAVGTGDINGDGWTDMYIANDFGHDDCYLNKSGQYFERQQGVFSEDLGLDTYKGMNSSFGDVDGNLKEDIYVSNVHHALQAEGSLLWLNFSDLSKINLKERAAQMGALNEQRFGWGAAMADLNLDGYLDIVQANGMVSDDWDKLYDQPVDYWYFQEKIAKAPPSIHSYSDKWADIRGKYVYPNEPDRIYLNVSNKHFEDVADKVGFNHRANTRGVAAVDLDNDGDLDLVVTDQFGAPKIYENKVNHQNWIGFQLIGDGKHTNRDAVGTKVWLSYSQNGKQKIQFREVHLVNGFSAQGDHRLVFGLGEGEIDHISLKIQWHNGPMQNIETLTINQYHTIKE